MRKTGAIVGVALAAAAGVSARAAATAAESRTEPVPLRGVPLRGETGLRLLVADAQPFVLSVDTGATRRLRGVAASARGVVWVVGVGGRAGVVVADDGADADLYGVRGRSGRISPLGRGMHVWPASDGRSVWIQKSSRRFRCTVTRVALDGREVRAARAFLCATGSDPAGGSLGVVVRRTRVVDPVTARTVLRARWGILAVAGTRAVLAGPGRRLTLLDAASGSERRLRAPSILGGTPEAAADPRGRFVALAYGNPAWRGGGDQVLDVWLLDTRTGELTQLPGMPAFVSLKRTSLAWTHDSRLVLLAESGQRNVVAVWRPGGERLTVKTVRLPKRSGGSDSFAVLG